MDARSLFFAADDHWHAWAGSLVVFLARYSLSKGHHKKAEAFLNAHRDYRRDRKRLPRLIAVWIGHGPPEGFPCFVVEPGKSLEDQMPCTFDLDEAIKRGEGLDRLFVSLSPDLGAEETRNACMRFSELFRRHSILTAGMWMTREQAKWGIHCDWSKIMARRRELEMPPIPKALHGLLPETL